MANRKKKPEYTARNFSISLAPETIATLDNLRDIIPRSTYIAMLIREKGKNAV